MKCGNLHYIAKVVPSHPVDVSATGVPMAVVPRQHVPAQGPIPPQNGLTASQQGSLPFQAPVPLLPPTSKGIAYLPGSHLSAPGEMRCVRPRAKASAALPSRTLRCQSASRWQYSSLRQAHAVQVSQTHPLPTNASFESELQRMDSQEQCATPSNRGRMT